MLVATNVDAKRVLAEFALISVKRCMGRSGTSIQMQLELKKV